MPHPTRLPTKTARRAADPAILESRPGLLSARPAAPAAPAASTPPPGYRLVQSGFHQIGTRDLVFLGGLRSYWLPARRAGELGSLRRDSVALGVAALAA